MDGEDNIELNGSPGNAHENEMDQNLDEADANLELNSPGRGDNDDGDEAAQEDGYEGAGGHPRSRSGAASQNGSRRGVAENGEMSSRPGEFADDAEEQKSQNTKDLERSRQNSTKNKRNSKEPVPNSQLSKNGEKQKDLSKDNSKIKAK